MKIWVDLANSPHVLFFAPLIEEMRRRGMEPWITARDFAQTEALAELLGLEVEVIGGHGGRRLVAKGRAILHRGWLLRKAAARRSLDLAVSHNSYAHCLAARSLGIPYVTIMDYEHTPANHLNFRLSERILLPSAIPIDAVRVYGADESRVVFYNGFKEQVYLNGFLPDRTVLDSTLPPSLWNEFIVVVARPPADFALYHRFHNPLFERWLHRVGTRKDMRVILLPRTLEQHRRAKVLDLPSVIIPERPLDGPNLIHHADLILSAGGTMNREAALLGVPAYSLFAGRTAAVDRELEGLGRLRILREEEELDQIRLEKKEAPSPLTNPGLTEMLVDNMSVCRG